MSAVVGHSKKVSEKVKKRRKLLFWSNLHVPSYPWSISRSFSYFSEIRISSSLNPAEGFLLSAGWGLHSSALLTRPMIILLQGAPGAWGPNIHLVLFHTDMPFSSNLLPLHAHYLEFILRVTAPSLKTEIKWH